MSKKITKILGLVLTIMLIASIFVPAAPAAAAYGEQQFQLQPIPTNASQVLLAGSDVTDIAIGTGVIYAIDGATATGNVYKSTDGGKSWTKTPSPGTYYLTKISVAPDNTNVIAVTNGYKVYSSTDAGSSWSDLTTLSPAPVNGAYLPSPWTGAYIADISVAPARTGTLLGREYVIAVSDPAAGSTAKGDVLILGNTNTWTSVVPTTDGDANVDYIAVKVTPNFVGDRSVVAIGAAKPAITGVVAQVIATSGVGSIQSTVYVATTNTTLDFGSGASAIVSGSIALPSDFDATTTSGRRAYIGFSANNTGSTGDNDVYRIDDTSAKALSAVSGKPVYSVTYAGTQSSGTVIEARKDTQEIKFSTDMTSSSPTWTAAKKVLPLSTTATTLTTTNNIVVAAADFATSRTVYQGSTGADSGFAVSIDGGISFDQISLIDANYLGNSIGTITSGPSFSGKTMFLMTSANATGGAGPISISLWKGSVPTSDTTWSRIYVSPGIDASPSVTLMADYTTTSTMLIVDRGTSSTDAVIFRSTDAGATWNTRTPPARPAVGGWTFQDSNIGYLWDASNNIFKTTNGAWTWSTAVTANVGTIKSATVGKTDELIIGGHGKIAISKDGGTTFTVYDGANSNDDYRIAKDTGYATNNLLWLADGGGNTNKVYKWTPGVDATPIDLLNSNPAATISGISISSGVLYIAKSSLGVSDRAVNPTETPSQIKWDRLDTGTPGAVGFIIGMNDVNRIVYLRVSSPPALYAQTDYMATAKPKIVSPSGNLSLGVDPNTGEGQQFTLTLAASGSGQGLADVFDIEVAEVAAGWAGAFRTDNIPALGVTNPTSPQLTNNIFFPAGGDWLAGKSYQLRIRAADQLSNEAAHSPWSDTLYINIAQGGRVEQTQYGVVLTGPQGGATNVSPTPGFAWAPVFGAIKYRFTLATDAALTKAVAGTPVNVSQPSFQVTTPLADNTVYFWGVQVVDPSEGPLSIATFTTAAKVVVAPAPTFTIPPIVIPQPTFSIPAQPAPTITITTAPAPPAQQITPAFIWAIIIIGAILVIAVVVLIVRTRKVP